VIDLQGLARSSLFCWLAQGRLSVGVEDWREGAPGLYDLVVPRPSFSTHAVDWYLQVLKALEVPVHWHFVWMPPRPQALRAFHAKWKPGAGRWMVINPGARWTNKRWPVQSFAEVARRLGKTYPDLRFAILGGPDDRPLGEAIAQVDRQRCLDLTGQTSLSELVEWIRLSQLVLSNDTGPMHIAAALGKPVVSLFGPTEPRRTGPYRQGEGVLRVDLPCAPCLKPRCSHEQPLACLHAIAAESVCAKISQLLPVE
jgi:ADP-heptose:LPS heptosyltransferase